MIHKQVQMGLATEQSELLFQHCAHLYVPVGRSRCRHTAALFLLSLCIRPIYLGYFDSLRSLSIIRRAPFEWLAMSKLPKEARRMVAGAGLAPATSWL